MDRKGTNPPPPYARPDPPPSPPPAKYTVEEWARRFGEARFVSIDGTKLVPLAQAEAVLAEYREHVRSLIADDASAATFQTMGQYRTALLKALRA